MTHSQQLAKHFKEVFFGGNWTASNLKDQIADVTWQEALIKTHDLNTIATLVQHITYYVDVTLVVLQGGKLNAKDEWSFAHPEINSEQDWSEFLQKKWDAIEKFYELLILIPDEQLWEVFEDDKYGIYYRNMLGIVEHSYYHLGQIALIKKIIRYN